MATAERATSRFAGGAFIPGEFLRQIREENDHLACVAVYGAVGNTPNSLLFARFFDPSLGRPEDSASDEEDLVWETDQYRDTPAGAPQLLAMVRKYLADADIALDYDDRDEELTIEGVDRDSAEYTEAGQLVITGAGEAILSAVVKCVRQHNADVAEERPALAKRCSGDRLTLSQ